MRGEQALHEQFEAWLRKQGFPYLHSRMDQRATIAVGWPDFSVFWQGRAAFVELKFGKGRLSDAQVECLEKLRLAGCPAEVCYSLDSAINHVNTALGLSEAAGEAVAAQNEASVAAPKEYLASARYVGEVVVARNSEGHMGYVRMAKEADRGLPRWTEALSW